MGYSKNTASIMKVKSFLDQLVEAKSDLAWPTDNAHMLGYYLRQAMTVAKAQHIEPYHELKDKWIIKNRGLRLVAEYRMMEYVEPLAGMLAASTKMEVPGAGSLAEIVGAAIQYKNQEMTFPDAAVTKAELPLLHQWCGNNGYFMIVSDTGMITLTKTNPGGIEWTPEDAS